jgi:hypothetical protein
MSHAARRSVISIAAVALATCVVLAVDPPDLRLNPFSGLIEAVDATWSGANYNVRYTAADNTGVISQTSILTTNSANDLDPRISVGTNGDAFVAWWRDLTPDAIILRKHTLATGAWGPERTAGMTSENNSHPRLMYTGDKTWVAYQIQYTKSRGIGAQIIDDDPEPIRCLLATTTYSGDLDVQISFESGHLWVTWIDTSYRVGYAQYTSATGLWSTPSYESYASDSIAAARARIRDRVLGSNT